MLKIHKEAMDKLNFDFDAALKQFAEEKRLHQFTVDVPAPAAHPLVEAAFAAGGFEIEEPEMPPQPERPDPPVKLPDSLSAQALKRLEELKGQPVDVQLDELRALLAIVIGHFPG